jgi:hypothetical protein
MTDQVVEQLAGLSVAEGGVGGGGGEGGEGGEHVSTSPGADGPTGSGNGTSASGDAESHATTTARAVSDRRKLFVGGLPQGSTEERIAAVFAPYGTVEEVRACRASSLPIHPPSPRARPVAVSPL